MYFFCVFSGASCSFLRILELFFQVLFLRLGCFWGVSWVSFLVLFRGCFEHLRSFLGFASRGLFHVFSSSELFPELLLGVCFQEGF